MNKNKKKSKGKKSREKQVKSRRVSLGRWAVAKIAAGVLVLAGLLGATLSGAVEHLVPVDPLVDKVAGTADAIKIESVSFDNYLPMAFNDPQKAEDFTRFLNSKPDSWLDAGTPSGGVPANPYTTATIHLRVNREQNIRITNIRIDPMKKLPPIEKALVCPLIEKGGGGDVELLDFKLDSANPVGYSMTDDGKATKVPFFQKRTVTLAKDETVGFMLFFRTSEHHVRFSVTVDFQFGTDERGSLVVDDHGKPFELTAIRKRSAPGAVFAGQSGQRPDYERLWLPAPKDLLQVVEVEPTESSVPIIC